MEALVTRTSLCLPFPMRNGSVMAQVIIPRDMTKAEAERLAAFVRSLAMPEPASAEPSSDAARSDEQKREEAVWLIPYLNSKERPWTLSRI